MLPMDPYILFKYILFIFVIIHCFKFRGIYKTLLLFFGAVIIGGGIENVNVIFGGYEYPAIDGGTILTIPIGKCPLDIIFGWFIIIYCCSYFSHSLIGKFRGSYHIMGVGTKPDAINNLFLRDTILRAALSGFLAITLDFIIDPTAVANEWWIWRINNIYVLDVPLGNFLGWWSLIFWGVFFYDMIVTYGSVKQLKELKISGLWVVGTLLTALFTGLVLMATNAWWGMEGIRTDMGGQTSAFHPEITSERLEGIIGALVMVVVAIGAILLASQAPNKLPEPRPTQYLWKILPSLYMLSFWGFVFIMALLTSPQVAAAGVLFCITFLIACIYLIVRPYE